MAERFIRVRSVFHPWLLDFCGSASDASTLSPIGDQLAIVPLRSANIPHRPHIFTSPDVNRPISTSPLYRFAANRPTMEMKRIGAVMRRWLPILAGLLLIGDAAPAGPPWIDDVLLTLKARKLLHDDPELRRLGLGIIVENRVAILWGPVPTLDQGLRAESRLRGMIELRDVRNELDVIETGSGGPVEPPRPSIGAPEAEPRPLPPTRGVPVELGDPRPISTAMILPLNLRPRP
jgi:hypothetical protein